MIDIDSIRHHPVYWMVGDTDITDIDSKGTPPGSLDWWGHLYYRHRLNRSTNQYLDLDSTCAPTVILDEWGRSYDRLRLNRGTTR